MTTCCSANPSSPRRRGSPTQSVLLQKCVDQLSRLVRLLDLWEVRRAGNELERGVRDECLEVLGVGGRADRILLAPEEQRGHGGAVEALAEAAVGDRPEVPGARGQ